MTRVARLVFGLVLCSAAAGCLTRVNSGPGVYCDALNPCSNASLVCSPSTSTCTPPDMSSPDMATPDLAVGCITSTACASTVPVCDETSHMCRVCQSGSDDAACATNSGGMLPFCASSGSCVACRQMSDCTNAQAPICAQGSCVPCTAHAQCPSLVCVAGSCLAQTDVVYVDNTVAKCATSGGDMALSMDGGVSAGTMTDPYCEIGVAVMNAAGRSTVHVAGGASEYQLPVVVADTGGTMLTILGPGRLAKTVATLQGCISVKGTSNLVIDGLVVESCGGTGIACQDSATLGVMNTLVDGNQTGLTSDGCTLNLDGNVLSNNRSGALRLVDTTYQIVNQVIVGNGVSDNGVSLGDTSTGRFAFNTVAQNVGPAVKAGAIDCGLGAMKTVESSIVFGNSTKSGTPNNGSQLDGNCSLQNVVTGVDPFAGATMSAVDFVNAMMGNFRLIAGDQSDVSCCIDKVMKPDFLVDHDADGLPRPAGMADIGAYQLQ